MMANHEQFSHKCKHWRDYKTLRMFEWQIELLWGFATHLDNLRKILSITMQGNKMVQDFPKFLKILGIDEEHEPERPDSEISYEEIKARAEFAKSESERDHPILHAYIFVAAWSAFEALIEDLGVGFLTNRPDFLKNEVFSKV